MEMGMMESGIVIKAPKEIFQATLVLFRCILANLKNSFRPRKPGCTSSVQHFPQIRQIYKIKNKAALTV